MANRFGTGTGLSLPPALATAMVLSLALAPAPAAAQRAPRITNQIAANHYQLGTQYFQIARYTEAAREFNEAYEITHQPELQFNIGRALEANGDIAGALEAYQRFLDAGAPGYSRDTLQARMNTLRERMPPPGTTEPAGGAQTPTPTQTSATTPPTQPATQSQPAADAGNAGHPPPPPREHVRTTLGTVGPVAAAGVGLVCAGLAVWQGISASNHIAMIDGANQGTTPWTRDVDNAYRTAPGEVTAAWALGIAGGVLVAAGAVWFALGVPSEERDIPPGRLRNRATRLRPFLVPGNGGALLGVGGVL